ncbi:hypothetical protein BSL78_21102 [Apostichopus japonicus]|uniref:MAM domain-containing protein n=1 Tax=Stichopus japonicus TaxID=307972 RepID=A0A2G8K225_STIJA|nr:hypothetical protein BSL78_21102 [Apostichopus japonicus]
MFTDGFIWSYYPDVMNNNINNNNNNIPSTLYASELRINLPRIPFVKYTSVSVSVTYLFWGSQGSVVQLKLFENRTDLKTWDSKTNGNESWSTETVSLNGRPNTISFISFHNSSNDCGGVAIDEIIITADPMSPTDFPTTTAPPEGPTESSAMKLLIILLLCAVGFLVLVIFFLVLILLRRKNKGEFEPPGITVANSTYDLPATISGINTSENQYFKYGTYSGERFPPVSPSSDISGPIVKFPKKKRKGLTLPMRASQAVGSFDYRGMSPMSSPSPQSPDSAGSSRLYVQKRPKLGLLGRAQAMIYGSPKPMSKRLSRSLPDNLEWTLSGYTRGPYQITDLLNGRIELKEDPPTVEHGNPPSNVEREPFIQPPQLSPPLSPNGRFEPPRESPNSDPPQNSGYPSIHQIASPKQHMVINDNFKERTLDRSALTLPLNVKRPSWDADKYQVIFDSGEGKCELLDLLQDSPQGRKTDEYEPVGQQGSAISRNNNRRSSPGNSSRSSPRGDTLYGGTVSEGAAVASSSRNSGSTTAGESTSRDGTRPSLKKKPHFLIEKRRVSFSNKTCIIDQPAVDEYDDVEVDCTNTADKIEKDEKDISATKKPPSFQINENPSPSSKVGYVNVDSSNLNDTTNLSTVKEWEEPPSEYEMISPTDDGPSDTVNVYDELARDFPLKKNPRSNEPSSSDAYNRLAMMPDVVQTASKTDSHRLSGGSDYDNVKSPVATLRSPREKN